MDALYVKIIEDVKADPEKYYNKALEYKADKDYTMWIMYITMLANKGYKPAMDHIVDDYHNDMLHKKQNYGQTKGFYELTAKYSYSANYLGYMYGNSCGVLENRNKSKEYYEMSTAQGNLLGIVNLGTMYIYGQGIKCDIPKGIQLYKLAAKKGKYYSAETLAIWYYDGHEFDNYVLKINYKKAQKYAMIAIGDEKCTTAYDILGRLYYYGKNGVTDVLKAKEYFEKSIAGGGIAAMYNLGHMYITGKGIPQDKFAAERLFKQCEIACKLKIKNGDFNIINQLVDLYFVLNKYLNINEYFDKQEIIKYFRSIKQEDKINKIFNLAQYSVDQADENKLLKEQVEKLETEKLALKEQSAKLETENAALKNKLASVLNLVDY